MGSICSHSAEVAPLPKNSVVFKYSYKNVEFENINGDIPTQYVDAIVNPANNQLVHKTGLSNSILERGGNVIQQESDKFMDETEHGYLDVSTAVTTSAGKLQAKYVIHVVSPIWNGGVCEEDVKLEAAITNVLAEAQEKGVISIAIPYLSGGGFGFPKEKGVGVTIKSCLNFIDKNPDTCIKLIKFVNLDAPIVKEFKSQMEKLKTGDLDTSRQEDE